MRTYFKRFVIAVFALAAIGTASLVTSDPASARPGGFHGRVHGGHWGGHWGGHRGGHWGGHWGRHWGGHWRGPGFGFAPAFAGALAFGALAAPYYYGAPVAYYGDCFPRRRVVGYTAWGRPIVRIVRRCY
jgi:hypothetical protein